MMRNGASRDPVASIQLPVASIQLPVASNQSYYLYLQADMLLAMLVQYVDNGALVGAICVPTALYYMVNAILYRVIPK